MAKISTNILDLDSDIKIEGKNEFAKNYDVWRKKEELNKLKNKYGQDALEDSESSSSSDDEEGMEITENMEKEFFKTLSYLKKKDPKIYDNKTTFFTSTKDNQKVKSKKDQPIYLKDYERKLILENNGLVNDEEEENERPQSPAYVVEQNQLKQDLKMALSTIEDDDEEENCFSKERNANKQDNETKLQEYKQWLVGQEGDLNDDDIKLDLKPLKDFWNDPNLDSGEKFLRDYILKKKYLDNDEKEYIPSYEEIIHDSDESLSDDERAVEEQEEFEHKYNFRFEEPDQEFIKRYPRTIEKSLRKTDDRRKIKRAETKERKQKEKEEKMADIRKLKELKRKEIEDKIEKLKEVTGNTELVFEEDDLEADFDPEAYDKRMQTLFNNDFYEGPEEEQKPEFPDIDEELEIENWNHWNIDHENQQDSSQSEPHCEDDDFIMDADYDPSTSTGKETITNTKGRKKRKRKSKVAEALSRPKPKYDPNNMNYEKYFEEFYKLECEDVIGDMPCRFKYREVIPNDFGLSVEEILLAKDRELNKWCSLKKITQRRPDTVEKYDQIAYSKKAKNVALKQKILPSLFSEEVEENEEFIDKNEKTNELNETSTDNENKSKNVVLKQKIVPSLFSEEVEENEEFISKNEKRNELNETSTDNENKSKKLSGDENTQKASGNSKKPKKKKEADVDKDKLKNHSGNAYVESKNAAVTAKVKSIDPNSKQRKKKRKNNDSTMNKNQKKKKVSGSFNAGISDARLSAYGINPKKFKNKLKYGNKPK